MDSRPLGMPALATVFPTPGTMMAESGRDATVGRAAGFG